MLSQSKLNTCAVQLPESKLPTGTLTLPQVRDTLKYHVSQAHSRCKPVRAEADSAT